MCLKLKSYSKSAYLLFAEGNKRLEINQGISLRPESERFRSF